MDDTPYTAANKHVHQRAYAELVAARREAVRLVHRDDVTLGQLVDMTARLYAALTVIDCFTEEGRARDRRA